MATRAHLSCARCGASYDGLSHLVDGSPLESDLPTLHAEVPTIAARLAREAQPTLEHVETTGTPPTDQISAVYAASLPTVTSVDRFDVALERAPESLPPMQVTGRWSTPAPTPHRPSRALQWLGIISLSFLLLAQIVHTCRASLASWPVIGPTLSSAYALMGMSLEARWDPASYEVQKIERVDADTPGTLRLHARIINHGLQAQPAPLLRVTLQDGHGQPLGRRDFSPNEYMADHPNTSKSMAPDERLETTLVILDPGSAAVSFSLEACLLYDGTLTCSTDLHPEKNP